MCPWQKSSKLSRISSGEDDLEKDGKDDDHKSGSEGGDPDNDIIQNTTDSKVGFINNYIFSTLVIHSCSPDTGAQEPATV